MTEADRATVEQQLGNRCQISRELTAIPVLVVLVAVGASLVPASRRPAADPMTSLRAE